MQGSSLKRQSFGGRLSADLPLSINQWEFYIEEDGR